MNIVFPSLNWAQHMYFPGRLTEARNAIGCLPWSTTFAVTLIKNWDTVPSLWICTGHVTCFGQKSKGGSGPVARQGLQKPYKLLLPLFPLLLPWEQACWRITQNKAKVILDQPAPHRPTEPQLRQAELPTWPMVTVDAWEPSPKLKNHPDDSQI